MVVNKKYKFIFIHVPKAAGTSVMNSLSGLPGNKKRWLAKTKHETLEEFTANIGRRRTLLDHLRGISPDNYFHFAFVRNPWDRMASFYRYLIELRPRNEIKTITSFKDFLIQSQADVPWIEGLYSMRPQVDYFKTGGNLLKLDFLGHFEYLNEDFNKVAERLNSPVSLPHLNKSSNTQRDYKIDYDDEMIEIVARRFSDDIRLFGYSFDSKIPAKRYSGPINECLPASGKTF